MTKGQKIAVGISVGIPLLCCLGGIGFMQGMFGKYASTKDTEVALARKDGIPTTAEDLTALTHAPDADNAAPFYRQAVALVAEPNPLHKDLDAISVGMSRTAKPEARQAAVAALARLRRALDLARKASGYARCDFRRDWSLGANVLFPEYATMKGLSKALCLEAEIRSRAGDWRGALGDLQASERISHHAAEDPILIGLLVSITIEAITDASLRRIIDQHSHDPMFLSAAKQFHDEFGRLADFRRVMGGELAMGRVTLQQLHSFTDMDPSGAPRTPNPLEKAVFQSSMVKNAFDARLTGLYRQLIEKLPADPARWEDALRAVQNTEASLMADRSLSGMANQVMIPVLSNSVEAIGMQLTRRNVTDTALALLLDCARTGKLPRFLPDYGPSRMDPFSGNPLIYRTEGKGFILYSVGRDRVDNGGIDASSGSATVDSGIDEVIRIH